MDETQKKAAKRYSNNTWAASLYPEPHLKILKSIKGDEIENYLILFIEHCFSVIYVISYNLIAFSHFARYLADVGKMWGKYLVVPRKRITFVPRFPHHQ